MDNVAYKDVLIVAINKHWPGISRLPSALTRAGFKVSALAPIGSYLSYSNFLDRRILYPTFTYSRGIIFYPILLIALLILSPQLIIAGDEDALLALHRLANFLDFTIIFAPLSNKIRNSSTKKEFDHIIENKSSFIDWAKENGIRVPKQALVKNEEELISRSKEISFPLVLKSDSSYGGCGVWIVNDEVELKKIFLEQIKRKASLKDLVRKFLFISIFNEQQGLSLQQYISGQISFAPFASWDGKLLGINCMGKLHTYPGPTGPASAIQGVDVKEMNLFTEKLVKGLNYNGFGSMDFIIEDSSGLPYVIEFNARPVPTTHLSDKLVPNDLPVRLYKYLNQKNIEASRFSEFKIALFPNELRRDPQSSLIKEGFLDIPNDDDRLKEVMLKDS